MKHLKTYKIFESDESNNPWSGGVSAYANKNKEIERVCYDILLDLTDEGYFDTVRIELSENYKTVIFITVSKNKDSFSMDQIKPVVDRLISYLETEGFGVIFSTRLLVASSAGPGTEYLYKIRFEKK